MKRKQAFAIAGLLLVIILAIFVTMSAPPDPVYAGKRLSEWLPGVGPNSMQQRFEQGEENHALRTIGTNALPYLIRELKSRDSAVWRRLLYLLEQQDWNPGIRPSENRQVMALTACEILGKDARGAVPAIKSLLAAGPDLPVTLSALKALAAIGPAASPALPEMIQVLEGSPDPIIQEEAAAAVVAAAPVDPASVSVLIKVLNSGCGEYTKFKAAWTLREIGPAAAAAIPELTKAMERGSAVVQSQGLVLIDGAREALVVIGGTTNQPGIGPASSTRQLPVIKP